LQQDFSPLQDLLFPKNSPLFFHRLQTMVCWNYFQNLCCLPYPQHLTYQCKGYKSIALTKTALSLRGLLWPVTNSSVFISALNRATRLFLHVVWLWVIMKGYMWGYYCVYADVARIYMFKVRIWHASGWCSFCRRTSAIMMTAILALMVLLLLMFSAYTWRKQPL
jgi:hypothetical protein